MGRPLGRKSSTQMPHASDNPGWRGTKEVAALMGCSKANVSYKFKTAMEKVSFSVLKGLLNRDPTQQELNNMCCNNDFLEVVEAVMREGSYVNLR